MTVDQTKLYFQTIIYYIQFGGQSMKPQWFLWGRERGAVILELMVRKEVMLATFVNPRYNIGNHSLTSTQHSPKYHNRSMKTDSKPAWMEGFIYNKNVNKGDGRKKWIRKTIGLIALPSSPTPYLRCGELRTKNKLDYPYMGWGSKLIAQKRLQ